MATERLAVLAGAAALGEFTAPELASYTGVNPNTVRQVLQREQKRNGFFEHVEPRIKPANGRPAVLWRLRDEYRDQILDEIAREGTKIAKLHEAVDESSARGSLTDPMLRATMFVSSAEEAIARAYELADHDERQTLATIAINLLRAAKPDNPQLQVVRQASEIRWWEQNHVRLQIQSAASLDTISQISIESSLRVALQSARVLKQEELLRRRAHRVAAFAGLIARQADGLTVEHEDLMDAAESISAGSEILPVPQTLGWIKIFVDISIAIGNPAPVAVLIKSHTTPEQFFPVRHGAWSKVPSPDELTGIGYSIWVESWAEALLAYNLIPGIVVAYDDSPESVQTLGRVLRDNNTFRLGRAVVVASTTTKPQVAARVASGGGILYPVDAPSGGLLATVNRAVIQAMSAMPDLGISYSIASDIYQTQPGIKFMGTPALDALRALSGVAVHPSDLELAERTLAVFDEAVGRFNTVQPRLIGRQADPERNDFYEELVRRVADQLSDLGDSRRAISIAEKVLYNCRMIIESKPSLAGKRKHYELTSRRLAEIAHRREITFDMAWAYELSEAPAELCRLEDIALQ